MKISLMQQEVWSRVESVKEEGPSKENELSAEEAKKELLAYNFIMLSLPDTVQQLFDNARLLKIHGRFWKENMAEKLRKTGWRFARSCVI